MAIPAGRPELLHERALAERFAILKLILAVSNFLVIGMEKDVPGTESPRATAFALFVAGGFLLYMTITWLAIRKEWISLHVFQRILPLTDVLASSMLIIATDGYLSPFNLWLAISVVSAGFGSSRIVPIVTALLAVLAQILIAAIPQEQPMEASSFFVRTVYLFGFASLIASVSNELIHQSKALQAISRFGQELANVSNREGAVEAFRRAIERELKVTDVEVALGESRSGWYAIASGERTVGCCRFQRKEVLNPHETYLLSVFGERLSSALRRVELSRDLIDAAAREERQRYADELHDTHLQTLAAVDMHAQAVARQLEEGPVLDGVKQIKKMVRDAAAKTREFISGIDEQPQGGPAVIAEVFRERWGEADLAIEEGLDLSEGQWRAIRMMVQEGLNNAKMHGRATNVRFELCQQNGGVKATLFADGRNPAPNTPYGYGLTRLQTVVQANRGELELRSGSKEGSELVAVFSRKADS